MSAVLHGKYTQAFGSVNFPVLLDMTSDCMIFSTVFNIILVISQLPVHLTMLTWSLLTSAKHNILSKPLAAFPHNHCRNNGQL